LGKRAEGCAYMGTVPPHARKGRTRVGTCKRILNEKAPTDVTTGEAFRPEWTDFDRGIRVGNLEPHESIT
jgi:hypothetical protein